MTGPSNASNASNAPESTLLVPVPSAGRGVGRLRQRLDPASRLGVPPHVTVLYPFAPPATLDEGAMARLAACIGSVDAFEFELAEIGWFDDRVLYLSPSPASPFRQLTAGIVEAFPDYPPYRGEFPDVIPHLTLAEGAWAPRMRRGARRAQRFLPIPGSATDVWLMAPDDSGHWQLHRTFPLRRHGE